ncbi:uncharacterized protein LOC110984290 [Acanthaster planci]|uniref:Uncharacterized protein LOC110984290 n=1 Tax=Acanthaster planci TaxID=133434 RepID=A0A8B7Z309_ACAPL|nr:uncharacterized protein LOC110984290 [Acanthaster planci]
MAKLDAVSKVFGLTLFWGMTISSLCHQCNQLQKTMYAAKNSSLEGFASACSRPTRSGVLCGRDCSMDKRCKSFNFNDYNKVCELNRATRREYPEDFNATQGIVYFDADEDTLCHSLGDTELATPCTSGTEQQPAISCSEIAEVCQRPPNGMYYLLGDANKQHCVYCEMPSGLARFGKGNMQSCWNYKNEDREEVHLNIISKTEIAMIKGFSFNEFQIHTDVEFSLQADDSTNPSVVEVLYLPSFQALNLSIRHGFDKTRLSFATGGDRLVCNGERSTACGLNGLPFRDEQSQFLAITALHFTPRIQGASAHSDEWHRNRYSWSGSYYYILARKTEET